MPPARTTWYSTTLGNPGSQVLPLDLEVLGSLAEMAKTITIVSAFYDADFLRNLAGTVPTARRGKVDLVAYLHGFTGSRGEEAERDLRKVRAAWRRSFRSANIRLVSRQGLFHTKLLVFESVRGSAVLIGSANATSAAFTENEEVMLALEGVGTPRGVAEYLAAVEGHSLDLDDVVEPEIHSLVAFFRAGDIYYKPNVVAQFRFDLRLPDDLRQRMTRLTVDIPGITAKAARTYNLFARNEAASQAQRELEEGDDSKGEDARRAPRGKVSLRPYAVQTCYGWWAPRAYRDLIEDSIEKASARRVEVLTLLRKTVAEGITTGALLTQAKASFSALETLAAREKIDLPESGVARIGRFEQLLAKAKERLANDRWLDRASNAYVTASVPEMWGDPVAREEFADSFFDYIEYVTNASTEPLLWKSVRKAVGLGEHLGAKEARSSLERGLKDRGWSTSNWLLPRSQDKTATEEE